PARGGAPPPHRRVDRESARRKKRNQRIMATQIKPDEISSLLKSQLESLDLAADRYETGTVLQVGDGIARVHGLTEAMAGELVEVHTAQGPVSGLVLNLEEDSVGIALLGDASAAREGDKVTRTK